MPNEITYYSDQRENYDAIPPPITRGHACELPSPSEVHQLAFSTELCRCESQIIRGALNANAIIVAEDGELAEQLNSSCSTLDLDQSQMESLNRQSRMCADYPITRSQFVRSVLAVHSIVTNKLYKEQDRNLEEYFRMRFGISRAQVYRLIDCASLYIDFAEKTDIPNQALYPYPLKQRLCKTIRSLAPNARLRQLLWFHTIQPWLDQHGAVDALTSRHVRDVWTFLTLDPSSNVCLPSILRTRNPALCQCNHDPCTCHILYSAYTRRPIACGDNFTVPQSVNFCLRDGISACDQQYATNVHPESQRDDSLTHEVASGFQSFETNARQKSRDTDEQQPGVFRGLRQRSFQNAPDYGCENGRGLANEAPSLAKLLFGDRPAKRNERAIIGSHLPCLVGSTAASSCRKASVRKQKADKGCSSMPAGGQRLYAQREKKQLQKSHGQHPTEEAQHEIYARMPLQFYQQQPPHQPQSTPQFVSLEEFGNVDAWTTRRFPDASSSSSNALTVGELKYDGYPTGRSERFACPAMADHCSYQQREQHSIHQGSNFSSQEAQCDDGDGETYVSENKDGYSNFKTSSPGTLFYGLYDSAQMAENAIPQLAKEALSLLNTRKDDMPPPPSRSRCKSCSRSLESCCCALGAFQMPTESIPVSSLGYMPTTRQCNGGYGKVDSALGNGTFGSAAGCASVKNSGYADDLDNGTPLSNQHRQQPPTQQQRQYQTPCYINPERMVPAVQQYPRFSLDCQLPIQYYSCPAAQQTPTPETRHPAGAMESFPKYIYPSPSTPNDIQSVAMGYPASQGWEMAEVNPFINMGSEQVDLLASSYIDGAQSFLNYAQGPPGNLDPAYLDHYSCNAAPTPGNRPSM